MSGFARYLTPSEEHRRLGLACLGVGAQQVRRMNFDGRVLNCYGLMLVTRGGGWLEWGDRPRRRLPVRAPAAFVTFPGLYHAYQPDALGWSERWVLFDGPAAAAHESLGGLDREAPVIALGPGVQTLRRIFDSLNEAVEVGAPHRDVVAAALVQQLLAQLLVGRVNDDLSRVVRYLDEHAVEPLTVGEHARRLGLDEATLRSEVQRATGSTTKEYILRTRLSRAKRLLLSTDRPVREVAQAVGYDDPAYFTRLFTRRVGAAPTEFRRYGMEQR
ncbi:AraC family transcriptional regulator [Kitasatospora azatica]|uniref:AraC family transcriptional regulator n=1 Tax=Kitasatospora azatica TaxID=58347 RepID=UPI00055A53F0|nr:AraC family transcriptional regulator [Kitasatospora azatica]